MTFHHRGAKCRKVCFAQLAFCRRGVEPVSFRLGSRMNCVMLRSRHSLQIFRIVTLKPFYEFDAKPRTEVRIFAVGFLSTTPTRIAKDVYVGRPKREAVEAISIPTTLCLVIFGACLI